MSDVPGDRSGRIPEGMKWCPRCNGYGSSLKEESARCTHCGGSGLVWADRERPVAGRNGEPSDRR
jgi:DnaJ-class molecular chaperone